MITVYFTDCALRFVPADTPSVEGQVIPESELTRAKVINFFQKYNTLTVLCADCSAAFSRFATEFVYVEAAGGVVENERGQVLLIFRRGRWDLPKGHIEAGEDALTAAIRETEEETGVKGLKFVAPLSNTLHAYNVYGKWEIKRTYWFAFSTTHSATTPQTEEDIVAVKWCDKAEVERCMTESYPTIRETIYEYQHRG
ncbi:MAG: NUDIX domain-containing protein [Alistipes sp.]|nr:NUDIX domain-containing protein [Alistipes sp.]